MERPGRVAGVISRAQPCNHASAARASAPTHLRRPPIRPHTRTRPGRISPEQTRKKLKHNLRRSVRTLLTTRPVFDTVWEDLANLNFDCQPGPMVHPSRELMDLGPKSWKNFARWKRTISRGVLVSEAIMCSYCFPLTHLWVQISFALRKLDEVGLLLLFDMGRGSSPVCAAITISVNT